MKSRHTLSLRSFFSFFRSLRSLRSLLSLRLFFFFLSLSAEDALDWDTERDRSLRDLFLSLDLDRRSGELRRGGGDKDREYLRRLGTGLRERE